MRESNTRSLQVSMLGLGAMGLPMAARLAEHLAVTGYDPNPGRTELAAQVGVRTAGSAAMACRTADVAVISVRTAAQLELLLFGAEGVDGVSRSLRPDTTIIMTSTVGADAVRDAAAQLLPLSIGLVDAPVSGGSVRAAQGALSIMVGARQDHIEAARPVLDLLGSAVHVVGRQPGDGQVMKTVNQLLCGVHIAAAAEALALVHSLGLDLEGSLEILQSGAAASFMLADRGPRMIKQLRDESVEVRSRTDVMLKDMGIVEDLCRVSGVSSPVAQAAHREYLAAVAIGLAEQDDSILVTTDAKDRRVHPVPEGSAELSS